MRELDALAFTIAIRDHRFAGSEPGLFERGYAGVHDLATPADADPVVPAGVLAGGPAPRDAPRQRVRP